MAMVGLLRFQRASTALLVNRSRITSLPAPANSVMSAPATKAWGLARFPSTGALGGAPDTIRTRTSSASSIQAHTALREANTSAFRAFNLSGRSMVMQAMRPMSSSSLIGWSSTFMTSLCGGFMAPLRPHFFLMSSPAFNEHKPRYDI